MKVFIYTKLKRQERYLQEWCEYNEKLGFDGIIIDNNNDNVNDPLYKSSFILYIDRVGYKWEHVPTDGTPLPHYESALVVWSNDVLHNLRSLYPNEEVWMFNTDIDEFIDFKGHYDNIKLYIYYIKSKQLWNVFIWWEYYDDNNIVYDENDLCVSRFTHKSFRNEKIRQHIINGTFAWWEGKSICEIHHCEDWQCPHTTKSTIPPEEYENIDNVVIRHYYTKTLESWIKTKIPTTNTASVGRRPNIITTFFQYNQITYDKIVAVQNIIDKYLPSLNLSDIDKLFIDNYKKGITYINSSSKLIFVATRLTYEYPFLNCIESNNGYGIYKVIKHIYDNPQLITNSHLGFCYAEDCFVNDSDVQYITIEKSYFRNISDNVFLEFLCSSDNHLEIRKAIFKTKAQTYISGHKFFTTKDKFMTMCKKLIPIVSDLSFYIRKNHIYKYNITYPIEEILIPILLND